jgi:hypothetical protein
LWEEVQVMLSDKFIMIKAKSNRGVPSSQSTVSTVHWCKEAFWPINLARTVLHVDKPLKYSVSCLAVFGTPPVAI